MDSVVIGDLDNRILEALVRNGRATFSSLGADVGLSAHAVSERVRRLERAGVIRGYTAILDERRRGRGIEAFVDVRILPTTDPHHFERVARELDGILSMAFVTGRFDYVEHMSCHDAPALDHAVRRLRADGGVAATETRIVMRTVDTNQKPSPPGPG